MAVPGCVPVSYTHLTLPTNREDVINGSYSSEGWLYQDVYILKNEDMVDRFVEVLMIDSVFAQSTEDYTRIEIPGLDQAWVTERLECIAVKGTTISIFTHPFDSPEGMREALLK